MCGYVKKSRQYALCVAVSKLINNTHFFGILEWQLCKVSQTFSNGGGSMRIMFLVTFVICITAFNTQYIQVFFEYNSLSESSPSESINSGVSGSLTTESGSTTRCRRLSKRNNFRMGTIQLWFCSGHSKNCTGSSTTQQQLPHLSQKNLT